MVKNSLSLLLFLNFVVIFGANLNKYCNTNLCKGNTVHIACDNDQQIDSSCAAYSKVLKLSPKIKEKIVKKHNEFRNQLAKGKVPDFPSATRMATMQWSDELALMAKLNVKSCTGTHDSCRNTRNFKFSGQNINRHTSTRDTITLKTLKYTVYNAIDRWFQEHSVCPRDGTVVYNKEKGKCGHFTVMIADRNTHVGCAIIHMKSKQTVFTCNYATTNLLNEKLYNPGKATSQCKTGTNQKYSGLCSINEKYS